MKVYRGATLSREFDVSKLARHRCDFARAGGALSLLLHRLTPSRIDGGCVCV